MGLVLDEARISGAPEVAPSQGGSSFLKSVESIHSMYPSWLATRPEPATRE